MDYNEYDSIEENGYTWVQEQETGAWIMVDADGERVDDGWG